MEVKVNLCTENKSLDGSEGKQIDGQKISQLFEVVADILMRRKSFTWWKWMRSNWCIENLSFDVIEGEQAEAQKNHTDYFSIVHVLQDAAITLDGCWWINLRFQ